MSKPTDAKRGRRGRGNREREPFSDEPAVVFDQLALPLVIREAATGKFVNLAKRALRGDA